jgi:hypothetical protein
MPSMEPREPPEPDSTPPDPDPDVPLSRRNMIPAPLAKKSAE